MLPRIGVYAYDVDLHYALMEGFHSVSNRQLLHQLITEPFYSIREAFFKGQGNPYILREKHRKWCEYLVHHMGEWVDLPTWEELVSGEEGCCFHTYSDCLCDYLFEHEPEWVLFGDDVDLAYDIIDRLHQTLLVTDDADSVIQKLLEANPEMKDLILWADGLEAFYVIRSTKVERCGEVTEAPMGIHAFDYIASGDTPGDLPTYVLDDETVKAYAHLLEQNEDRRSAC